MGFKQDFLRNGSLPTVALSPVVSTFTLQLGERTLHYQLRRSARQSLALQVDAQGEVQVAAPWKVPLAEIEFFIRSHQRWLERRLRLLANAPALELFQITHGAQLPVLGKPVNIEVSAPTSARRVAAEWRQAATGAEALRVLAGVHTGKDLIAALRARAQAWFAGRVAEYCLRLGVQVPPVGITNARTRWGSCSPRTGIRLHWRLLHLPQTLSDYVVAHEVAHLVQLNHSPCFWAVVEQLYPDWRTARTALNQAALTLPRIDPAQPVAYTAAQPS